MKPIFSNTELFIEIGDDFEYTQNSYKRANEPDIVKDISSSLSFYP